MGASFSIFGCFVFEIWALRFRDLSAPFSSFGCFVFEIWVLRFRVLGASFSRFGCFVLRSSFSSASFSKLPYCSQLSWQPDRSNDDVVFLVPRVIFNNGSSEPGFGQENRHILHCLFRFKLLFRSRVVLGCCKTCAETSLKSSSSDQSSGLKEMFQRWIRWSLDEIFAYKLFKKKKTGCQG